MPQAIASFWCAQHGCLGIHKQPSVAYKHKILLLRTMDLPFFMFFVNWFIIVIFEYLAAGRKNEVRIIDFRSDTVTLPTEEMLYEMGRAPLGDDVYGDDVTVNKLEERASQIVGKEAALLVPSGTMGNLIAVMAHTTPGQEIILEESSHIYLFEVAGIARLAGVQARTIRGEAGALAVEEVKAAIRAENIHFPETGLICLENTHNMAGGAAIPVEKMEAVYKLAKEKNIPLHLDGARIFNAAEALKVDVKEIAENADSVMFCLSKGLCAPIGSILAGSKGFIDKSRKLRKMLGGGMRQAGIIAAAGIVALDTQARRLHQDHSNARLLAEELNQIDGVEVDLRLVQSNIINVDFYNTGKAIPELVMLMKENGILVNGRNNRLIRFVTHNGISACDIQEAVQRIKLICE